MLLLSMLSVKILASTRYKVAKFTSHGFGAAPGEHVNKHILVSYDQQAVPFLKNAKCWNANGRKADL